MGILNTFIEQASNIWWGIVAAVIVVAIIYLIIYFIANPSKAFSPFSFLVGVPLLPLLAFQFYLLFGACGIKQKCNEIATWIDALVPQETFASDYSREDVANVIDELSIVFPFFSQFIDTEAFAQSDDTSLGNAITHKFRTYLNWYIVRRVAWSIGFIALAIIGIIFTMASIKVRTVHPPRDRRATMRAPRRLKH